MDADEPIPTTAPPSAPGAPTSTGRWVLERFQLRKELQRRPGGELWLGRERDTRRPVVVRFASEKAEIERVRRAGAALARITERWPEGAPRVVRLVASAAEADGRQVLVTEHVEGATLGKVLVWTRFTPPRAVAAVLELCGAVRACHEAGVVVRDLHPDNVVVGRDERGAEVLWLAAFEGEPQPALGAPELLRGEPGDERTDVYGLGLVLYRLLTGRWPFDGRDEVVIAAQLGAEPPALGQHNPRLRLPRGLEEVVLRCLAKRPEDRFQAVSALQDALRPLATVPQRDWVVATGAEATLLSEESEPSVPERRAAGVGWLALPLLIALLLTWWIAAI